MDDTPSFPIDDLKAFRAIAVEERRKLVRAALKAYAKSRGRADRSAPTTMKIIQEQIEAIDRAITDEENLQRRQRPALERPSAPVAQNARPLLILPE